MSVMEVIAKPTQIESERKGMQRFVPILRPHIHYTIAHRPRPSSKAITWITDAKYLGFTENSLLHFELPNGQTRKIHRERVVELMRMPKSMATTEDRAELLDKMRERHRRRSESNATASNEDEAMSALDRARAAVARRRRSAELVGGVVAGAYARSGRSEDRLFGHRVKEVSL